MAWSSIRRCDALLVSHQPPFDRDPVPALAR
jgi:hypothetical protein